MPTLPAGATTYRRIHGLLMTRTAPVDPDATRTPWPDCPVTAELVRQHAHVREDLARLRALLADAVARLNTGWDALSGHLTRSKTAWVGRGDAASLSGDALIELVGSLERELQTLVAAMQFQDLATQIADHVDLRVAQTQRLASALSACRDDAAASDDPCLEAATDAGGDERIAALIAESRAATARHPVPAIELTGGAVELF